MSPASLPDSELITQAGSRRLPDSLRVFAILCAVIMGLSWTIALLYPVNPNQFWLTKGMWPRFDDWFADLFHYDTTFAYLHSTRFFTDAERFAYPAPSVFPYLFFIHMGPYRLAVFFILGAWLGVVAAMLLARALARLGVRRGEAAVFAGVLVVTSWPLLFLLERGNIELVVVALTFGGALAYWKDRPILAAALWGVAGSMKIYPILMLGLFLNRQWYRAFLVGTCSFAGALVLSFWYIGPTIPTAAMGSVHGISGFVSTYANQSRGLELTFDHSLLAVVKNPLSISRFAVKSATFGRLSQEYVRTAALVMLLAYGFRIRRLPRFNQFAIFSLCMVSLPPVSYDYTLCHLYPVFGILVLIIVRSHIDGRRLPGISPLLWCFLILLTSQTVVFYKTFHPNGLFKALALLVSLILLVLYPIPDGYTPACQPPGSQRDKRNAITVL